jgi:hypothetical protein
VSEWLDAYRRLAAGVSTAEAIPEGVTVADSPRHSGGGTEKGQDSCASQPLGLSTPPLTVRVTLRGDDGLSRSVNAAVDIPGALKPAELLGEAICRPGLSRTVSDCQRGAGRASAVIDFETRHIGGVDLRKVGAWRYAADPATEVVTLTFQVGDQYELWTPATGRCDRLASLAADPDLQFISHASFEQAVWQHIMVERYGFPALPPARWHDTQASCAYHALPLKLGEALQAIGAPVAKDTAGQKLTVGLSRPNKKTGDYPELTPEIVARVAEYNHVDVEGTVVLRRALGPLPKRERQVWLLDQAINRRGVGIDLDLVRGAKAVNDTVMASLVGECQQITDGLKPSQVDKVKDWLAMRGVSLKKLDGAAVKSALKKDLPAAARRVLEIRAITSSSSLKKYDAMSACAGADNRARGMFQYHGAHTGRWAGRLFQPQNLPKPRIEIADPEAVVAAIKTGSIDAVRPWGDPIDVLVSSLRYALVAQNGLFGAGDFASIEARIVLALAGQDDKVELLANGSDVYRDVAADIYGLNKQEFLAIKKDELSVEQQAQRQTGKNAVLGCGYGLGVDEFGRRFCQHLPPKGRAALADKVIKTYRQIWAPHVPRLWRDLERAAIKAVAEPGKPVMAECKIWYCLEKKGSVPFLRCQLPNGKKLHYPYAGLQMVEKWGKQVPTLFYRTVKGKKFAEIDTWGGTLTENVVSALARELLVAAMHRFEERGFPVVMHCHDEIVVEHPDITKALVEEIMSERPAWAEELNLPVAVEAWVGPRYRK